MSLYVADEAEGRVPMCVVPAPRAKGLNDFPVNYSKTVISLVRRFGILGVITMVGVDASREWASLPVFRCKWRLISSIGVWGTSSEIGYVIGFQPRLGHRAGSNRPIPVFVTPNNNRPAQPQSTLLRTEATINRRHSSRSTDNPRFQR